MTASAFSPREARPFLGEQCKEYLGQTGDIWGLHVGPPTGSLSDLKRNVCAGIPTISWGVFIVIILREGGDQTAQVQQHNLCTDIAGLCIPPICEISAQGLDTAIENIL